MPAFGYLVYFTGRSYSAAYYHIIGVPNDIVGLGFWDYAYSGAKGLNILMPVAFTLMLVGFLLYLTDPAPRQYKEHDARRQYALPLSYLFLFALNLLFLAVIAWLYPDLKASPAYVLAAAAACLVVAGLSIMLLYDKALLAWVKERRIISKLFLGATAIALCLFPHTSADAWGRFEGIMAKDSSPLVELYAQQEAADGILWEPTGAGSYRTVDDLYLLFSNQRYLVVRQVSDKVGSYVIPVDSILFMKIVGPGGGAR